MLPPARSDAGALDHHLLVLVAALLVLVLGVFTALARVGGPTQDVVVASVTQDVPGPVLLVPGYGGATSVLQDLAGALRAHGHEVEVVTLPGNGTGDLREVVAVLAGRVADRLAHGARTVDLVGFSAGGVASRLYAAQHGSAVRRVITLGSPHHGTAAFLQPRFVTGADCTPQCAQLQPGSELLTGLEKTPVGPSWLSLWTSDDRSVVPPQSSHLDGARNLVVQDLCPGLHLRHGDLPTDAAVIGVVTTALGQGPMVIPSDCATARAAGS